MSAVAFSINAFVGVWLVAMRAMAVAFAEGRRPTSRDVLKSVGLFVLIATPTAAPSQVFDIQALGLGDGRASAFERERLRAVGGA